MIIKKKPGKVHNITKFFEKASLSAPVPATMLKMSHKDNNNAVCSAPGSTQADPEMALQSAVAGQQIITGGQPTGREAGGLASHVTSAQPIRAEPPVPDQKQGDRGHLRIGNQDQKPMDSQGCSAGK